MAKIIKGKVVLTTQRHKSPLGEIITIYANGDAVARLRQIGKTNSDVRLEWLDENLQQHAVQFPLASLADVDAGAIERMWERHLKPGATGYHHPLCHDNPRKGKLGHPIADGMASAALEKEMYAIEPKIDFLHDCLGIGRFAEVYRTSDGFYMGRDFGDIGANAFLGKPSPQALRRSAGYFQKLSPAAQYETLNILAAHSIPPADMGIEANFFTGKPAGLSHPEMNNPMKLMTKAIEKSLPPLYSQEKVADPMVRVKFFNPTGGQTWGATEGSAVCPEHGNFDCGSCPKPWRDFMFFGWVTFGDGYGELGYFSLQELAKVRGRFGLGIERDLYFDPVPLSEFRRRYPNPTGGSFKVDVRVGGENKFVSNGVRLATREEAEKYARLTEMNWTAVTDTNVVPSRDPPNYTFTATGLNRLNPLAQFKCKICGAEAPKNLLRTGPIRGQFLNRMSWLRKHRKRFHYSSFRRSVRKGVATRAANRS
jgi:hypothetical protein